MFIFKTLFAWLPQPMFALVIGCITIFGIILLFKLARLILDALPFV